MRILIKTRIMKNPDATSGQAYNCGWRLDCIYKTEDPQGELKSFYFDTEDEAKYFQRVLNHNISG